MLLAVPGLADPTHDERTSQSQAIADLLWFPTGGGKTEGLPRRRRLHHGAPSTARSDRRVRGSTRRGGDHALHAPAADHPAVPAGHHVVVCHGDRSPRGPLPKPATTDGATNHSGSVSGWGTGPHPVARRTPKSRSKKPRATPGTPGGGAARPAQLTTCPMVGSRDRPRTRHRSAAVPGRHRPHPHVLLR